MTSDIIIPEKISEELAEETGLHIGDGTMNFYNIKNKIKGSYALRGHIIDDVEHYNKVIFKLYKKVYSLNISLRKMPSAGVYGFQKWSDDLVNFKHNKLFLPLGKKVDIKIPNIFFNKKELSIAVIRGIFDTDGMLYLQPKYGKLYPRIEISTICKNLGLQINNTLKDLNIRSTIYSSKRKEYNWSEIYKISVRGNVMLDKWMNIISPHNPKHWTKYQHFLNSV